MFTKRFFLVFVLLISISIAGFSDGTPFRISTSYRNLLSNDEQTGMLDKILTEALRRAGMQAEIIYTPTEKSLVDVNAGLLDAEINRIEGMEKNFPHLVRVPEPNMTMHFVAFGKKDIKIDGWESIKDLYIGVVRGWKILETNTRGFPNVVFVPSERELFTMLHKERIDIALYSKLTGYAALEEFGFTELRHIEPPLASRKMYLYVHEKHRDKAETIAEALRSMKNDGTYDRIVEATNSRYVRPE